MKLSWLFKAIERWLLYQFSLHTRKIIGNSDFLGNNPNNKIQRISHMLQCMYCSHLKSEMLKIYNKFTCLESMFARRVNCYFYVIIYEIYTLFTDTNQWYLDINNCISSIILQFLKNKIVKYEAVHKGNTNYVINLVVEVFSQMLFYIYRLKHIDLPWSVSKLGPNPP